MVRIEKTPARRFRRKSLPKSDKEKTPMNVESNASGIKFSFNHAPSTNSIAMDEDSKLENVDAAGLNRMVPEEGNYSFPVTGTVMVEEKADLVDDEAINQSVVSIFDQIQCEVDFSAYPCIGASGQSTCSFISDGNEGSVEPPGNEESDQFLSELQQQNDTVITNTSGLLQLSNTISRLKDRIEKLGDSPNHADKIKSLKKKLEWYENRLELRSRADGVKEIAQPGTFSGLCSTNSQVLICESSIVNEGTAEGAATDFIAGISSSDVILNRSDIPVGAVKMLVQKIENDKSMAQSLNSKGEKDQPKGMGMNSGLNEANDLLEKDAGADLNREDVLKAVADGSEGKEDVDQHITENNVQLSSENDGVLENEKIGPSIVLDVDNSKINTDCFVFKGEKSVGKKKMVKLKGKEAKCSIIRAKMKRRESMDPHNQDSERNKKVAFDNLKFEGLVNAASTSSELPNTEMVGKIDEAIHEELVKNVQNTNGVKVVKEAKDVTMGEVKDTVVEKNEDGLIKNVWINGNIVNKIKERKVDEDVSVKYIPPTILPDGSFLVDIPDEVA